MSSRLSKLNTHGPRGEDNIGLFGLTGCRLLQSVCGPRAKPATHANNLPPNLHFFSNIPPTVLPCCALTCLGAETMSSCHQFPNAKLADLKDQNHPSLSRHGSSAQLNLELILEQDRRDTASQGKDAATGKSGDAVATTGVPAKGKPRLLLMGQRRYVLARTRPCRSFTKRK